MNELIESLWKKFSYDTDISFYGETPENSEELMDYEDFVQAIQTACKAQRNACRRMCEHKLKTTHNPILDIILSAEITKEDYE